MKHKKLLPKRNSSIYDDPSRKLDFDVSINRQGKARSALLEENGWKLRGPGRAVLHLVLSEQRIDIRLRTDKRSEISPLESDFWTEL